MAVGVGVSQRQSATIGAEHITGKSVLKMGLQELQQYIHAEFAENPALTLEDYTECPACHSVLIDGFCPTCGCQPMSDSDDRATDQESDWQEDMPSAREELDESYPEQFAGVAAASSLIEHLKEQIRTSIDEEDRELAEFIVDSLDEDGYLREPMLEIATRFGRSVPEAELVLKQVQNLDPPGIAARDLHECLIAQIERINDDSIERRNAETLLRGAWDCVSRLKLDEAAKRINLSRAEIESALRFIQAFLNPYPAAMFHDPWQDLAPRMVPTVAPDLVVRTDDDGPQIEVIDPVSGRVAIDEVYATMDTEMSASKNHYSQADRQHVKEYVAKARTLIEALEFRKSTLRKVVDEIMKCQSAFFVDGPRALKPMTRKELAARIGVHESTVCRATQDKTLRLPSGDVITFEVLFDSALPVKEMVRQLAAERLSDGEIAKRLGEAGVQIARRTVAKYRDQLRVLPIEYRIAG